MISLVSFAASALIAAGVAPHLGSFAPASAPDHNSVTVAQDDSSGALPGSPDSAGVSSQDDNNTQPGELQNDGGAGLNGSGADGSAPDGAEVSPDSSQQPDDADSVPPPQTSMQPPDSDDSGNDSSAQQQQPNDNSEEEGQPSAGDEN
jgi:hypothetical protein